MKEPEFQIVFRWNVTAGVFEAELPNGAKFIVERNHISGKLANALTLFKSGVEAHFKPHLSNKPRPLRNLREDHLAKVKPIKRFDENGKLKIDIDELDLWIGEKELYEDK